MSAEDWEPLSEEERKAIFEAARTIGRMRLEPIDAEALLATFAELRAIDRAVLEVLAIQLIHLGKLSSERPYMSEEQRTGARQHASAMLHLSRIVHLAAHGD